MGVRRDRGADWQLLPGLPSSIQLTSRTMPRRGGDVVLCPCRHGPAGDLGSPLGDELVLPQGVLERGEREYIKAAAAGWNGLAGLHLVIPRGTGSGTVLQSYQLKLGGEPILYGVLLGHLARVARFG
jgi:hypothetical protein